MDTYRVKVNVKGEIVLPLELRDRLGLLPDETLDVKLENEKIILTRAQPRVVGPLVDFFEDLILEELRCDGCTGDGFKNKFLERKIQLSVGLDRLSQGAYREYRYRQAAEWRHTPELKHLTIAEEENGAYQVVITAQTERQLRSLPQFILRKIARVLESLEWDPRVYKRLRGPHYETYRVSISDENSPNYRIIYTVFGAENLVVVLSVGERRKLFDYLKQIID